MMLHTVVFTGRKNHLRDGCTKNSTEAVSNEALKPEITACNSLPTGKKLGSTHRKTLESIVANLENTCIFVYFSSSFQYSKHGIQNYDSSSYIPYIICYIEHLHFLVVYIYIIYTPYMSHVNLSYMDGLSPWLVHRRL